MGKTKIQKPTKKRNYNKSVIDTLKPGELWKYIVEIDYDSAKFVDELKDKQGSPYGFTLSQAVKLGLEVIKKKGVKK